MPPTGVSVSAQKKNQASKPGVGESINGGGLHSKDRIRNNPAPSGRKSRFTTFASGRALTTNDHTGKAGVTVETSLEQALSTPLYELTAK